MLIELVLRVARAKSWSEVDASMGGRSCARELAASSSGKGEQRIGELVHKPVDLRLHHCGAAEETQDGCRPRVVEDVNAGAIVVIEHAHGTS